MRYIHVRSVHNVTKTVECRKLGKHIYDNNLGRPVTQVASPRFPIAAARVRGWVELYGMRGTGADFLQIHPFPLPLIHCINCSTIISIIQCWYDRSIMDRSIGALGSTQDPYMNKKMVNVQESSGPNSKPTSHISTAHRCCGGS
jgi:hypothetical protein